MIEAHLDHLEGVLELGTQLRLGVFDLALDPVQHAARHLRLQLCQGWARLDIFAASPSVSRGGRPPRSGHSLDRVRIGLLSCAPANQHYSNALVPDPTHCDAADDGNDYG